ncbi:MAG: hypothetical protein WEB60_07950 [Terrimicrobiaceae bacterium]
MSFGVYIEKFGLVGEDISMSAIEVLDRLQKADPTELAMVRDTAESLLALANLGTRETQEIEDALLESESQFERGEGISVEEAWRKLGI